MKLGTSRSPKFKRLTRATGEGIATTIGRLELLWQFTSENAPQGDIGKWTDEEIETELEWGGSPGHLVDALAETGWLDRCVTHRLVVHDWSDHAPEYLKKRLQRAEKSFVEPIAPPSAVAADSGRRVDATTADNGCPPSHVQPCPTESCPTQSGEPASPAEAPEVSDIEAEVWDEILRTVETYRDLYGSPSKGPPDWSLTGRRRSRLRSVAKEFGPTACSDAIHGYAMRCIVPGSWPDRWKCFTADSILRPANVAQNIEAARQADTDGHARPYRKPVESELPQWKRATLEIMRRERLTQ